MDLKGEECGLKIDKKSSMKVDEGYLELFGISIADEQFEGIDDD